MTEVSFYILGSDDPLQRSLFACRLAEKAFGLGHRVWVRAADAAAATAFDELLWGFRPTSFVPHALAAEDSTAPVVIAAGDAPPPTELALLINLGHGVPDWFSQFPRAAEIVVQEPAVQQLTRTHWRFYRDHGCPLQTHHLQG